MPNCETPSTIKWMKICWVLHLKKTTTKQFLRVLGMWYLPFVWYFLRGNTGMDTLGVTVHGTFVRAPLPGFRGQLLWRRWARAPLLFHQRSITFRCRACTGVSGQSHQSHVFKNAFCFTTAARVDCHLFCWWNVSRKARSQMVNQRKNVVIEQRSEKTSGGNFGLLFYFYRKEIFSSVPQNDCSCWQRGNTHRHTDKQTHTHNTLRSLILSVAKQSTSAEKIYFFFWRQRSSVRNPFCSIFLKQEHHLVDISKTKKGLLHFCYLCELELLFNWPLPWLLCEDTKSSS